MIWPSWAGAEEGWAGGSRCEEFTMISPVGHTGTPSTTSPAHHDMVSSSDREVGRALKLNMKTQMESFTGSLVHLALVVSARWVLRSGLATETSPSAPLCLGERPAQQVTASRTRDSCSRCQCPLGSACAEGQEPPLPSRVRTKEKGLFWMGTGLSSAGWQAGFGPDERPPLDAFVQCRD